MPLALEINRNDRKILKILSILRNLIYVLYDKLSSNIDPTNVSMFIIKSIC